MTKIASTFDFSSSTFSRNATDFERSFFCALRYLLADPLTAAGKPSSTLDVAFGMINSVNPQIHR